jgi:hypothetical protein
MMMISNRNKNGHDKKETNREYIALSIQPNRNHTKKTSIIPQKKEKSTNYISKREKRRTKEIRTTISAKLPGIPLSSSTTNRTPSGGLFTKSLTSLATRANVLGGKFSPHPPTLTPIIIPAEVEDRDRVEEEEEKRDEEVEC